LIYFFLFRSNLSDDGETVGGLKSITYKNKNIYNTIGYKRKASE